MPQSGTASPRKDGHTSARVAPQHGEWSPHDLLHLTDQHFLLIVTSGARTLGWLGTGALTKCWTVSTSAALGPLNSTFHR